MIFCKIATKIKKIVTKIQFKIKIYKMNPYNYKKKIKKMFSKMNEKYYLVYICFIYFKIKNDKKIIYFNII